MLTGAVADVGVLGGADPDGHPSIVESGRTQLPTLQIGGLVDDRGDPTPVTAEHGRDATLPIGQTRGVGTGEVEDGGRGVNGGDRFVAGLTGPHARSGDQERHPEGGLVGADLAGALAVFAEVVPVVGGEHEDGVAPLPRLLELLDQASDVAVHHIDRLGPLAGHVAQGGAFAATRLGKRPEETRLVGDVLLGGATVLRHARTAIDDPIELPPHRAGAGRGDEGLTVALLVPQ